MLIVLLSLMLFQWHDALMLLTLFVFVLMAAVALVFNNIAVF
jgi:hypothetical protein